MFGDKVGQVNWSNMWKANRNIVYNSKSYRNVYEIFKYVNNVINSNFSSNDTVSILEIGCGNSHWLPLFAENSRFVVSGIDYSEIGCELARYNLKKESYSGEIICADVFFPPAAWVEKFDVVVSFGVAEHFDNTDSIIGAMAKYLKPGGIMITFIPNMKGANGLLQKYIMSREVFDMHLPLTPDQLRQAHFNDRLCIKESKYLMSTNFGVLNIGVKDDNFSFVYLLKRFLLAILLRISLFVWRFEDLLFNFPSKKAFSPYIVCVAKKESISMNS